MQTPCFRAEHQHGLPRWSDGRKTTLSPARKSSRRLKTTFPALGRPQGGLFCASARINFSKTTSIPRKTMQKHDALCAKTIKMNRFPCASLTGKRLMNIIGIDHLAKDQILFRSGCTRHALCIFSQGDRFLSAHHFNTREGTTR